MTRDEAMKVWRKACRAETAAPYGTPGDEAADNAAATVIQQAFAERDGEIRGALERISQWSDRAVMQPACAIDMRDTARQALTAKGDGRG